MNPRLITPTVADGTARDAAIDPHTSVLVQAPAGSGKTDLLTLRYLALLPTVAEPEQVLAITFTRKATAEMRERVLKAFHSAMRGPISDEQPHQRKLRELAAAALAHAESQSWNLLAQPQRLNIQTIDSLALSLAHQMPLLSRLGGQLTPVDDARPRYASAAQRTLALLGTTHEPELSAAVAAILQPRDASLAECESLIANMLKDREQLLHLLPSIAQSNPRWEELREELEAPFRREHEEILPQLQDLLAHHLPELLQLAHIALGNGATHLALLADVHTPEALIEVAHWSCLCDLLLTGQGTWRRAINKRDGFPADTHRAEGLRLKQLIESLSEDQALLTALCRARSLPPAAYSQQEWSLVKSIFTLLRRATAELRVIFAEHGAIDFAEASIAAHAALRDAGVQMRREDRIQHILVDEFQDTSRPQFALLRHLLQDWQPGDGRTCFFVGDPMQSIYLFRAAEASLFDRLRTHGLELETAHFDVTPLALSTNFRSIPAILQPLNDVFSQVFVDDDGADSVTYVPAVSSQPNADAAKPDALHIHTRLISDDPQNSTAFAHEAQADDVLQQILRHLPAIEQARRTGTKYRVAVLVRSRTHLPLILTRLRHQGIAFRGVKIEPLRDRPEILDLLSLLQALLHPADRVAWLAVLRAPWCGLTLPGLHAICGDPAEGDAEVNGSRATIPALLRQRADQLPLDDRTRARHVLHILERAAAAYADGALSTTPSALSLWLERTWHALGAPAFLGAQALANAEVFFAALAKLPADSLGTLDQRFNRALDDLYAEPDPATSDQYGVQVMTIHGAKGLEFEVVLLPGLERGGRADNAQLIRSLVRRRRDELGDELLLAPIGRKQDDNPAMYRWVGEKTSQRLRQEHKRLLYVACSRAIRELHLFAAVERDASGALKKPRPGTLLAAGWDGLQARVERALAPPVPVTGTKLIAMPPPSDTLAAAGDGFLSSVAAVATTQSLHRLPQSWFVTLASAPTPPVVSALQPRSAQDRLARIRGTVLHALLAHAAANGSLLVEDPQWARLANVLLRQYALGAADTASLRDAILAGLRNALTHDHGRWLLQTTAAAQSESSWSSLATGRLQRHRPDRIFHGGATPGEPGEAYLWIIDYKTAAPADGQDIPAFLAASREQYRVQLEAYSQLLRQLNTSEKRPHRLALYHPALPHLDWWSN